MTPATLHLSYDELHRLVLELPGGARFVGVVPVRCFPFTAPSELISFCDDRGAELYCLRSLIDIPESERQLLEKDLATREFLPVICKIFSITLGADPTLWHVDTDRGEALFALPSEDDVRRLGGQGAIIADVHGVRYRIPNTWALDRQSRKLLSRYL